MPTPREDLARDEDADSANTAAEQAQQHEPEEDDLSVDGDNDEDCQATVASTVFNLSNNIVGAGILTLPQCFRQASIVEGTLLLVGVGVLSGLSLVLIAVCCEATHCFSFRGMGERALGRSFGIAIQTVMFVYTFFSCVSFMILAGDFFSGKNGIPQGLCSGAQCDSWLADLFYRRFTAVALLTLLILAPLSSLRNLNALRFTSLLSMVGMFYLLFLLVSEYIAASRNGTAAPSSEIRVAKLSWGIFSAAPVVNVAFIAHYNVPRFYQEMKDRSIRKFALAVGLALGLCGSVYVLVALFGYLHFGDETKSDVLENFGKKSIKGTLGRVAMAAVVLFTYPLAFNSLRASAIALLGLCLPAKDFAARRNFLLVTFTLVALTFVPGSVLTDIGVVLDYKGAILGGCIGFAFPAWMFLARCNPSALPACCAKPDPDDAGIEAPLVDASWAHHGPGFTGSAKALRLWTRASFTFFAWAIVSGVMGVAVTTMNLVYSTK